MASVLRSWNWGAFGLSFMWAFFHRAWLEGLAALVLFCALPFIGPILAGYILARSGDAIAWRHGRHASIADFRKDMDIWDRYGIGLSLVMIFSSPWLALFFQTLSRFNY